VLAVLAGLIQVGVALLRLGGLARHVPESVVLGFMAGAGVLVALTQVPTVLGLEPAGAGNDHLLYRLWLTCTRGSSVHFAPLAVSLVSVVLIGGLHGLNGRLGVRPPRCS
jgi:SulP family sulfate permease